MKNVCIWLLNTNSEVISANQQWHKFYDIDPRQLPYKADNIEETIHKDDVEKFLCWHVGYDNHESFQYTARQLRSDGKWRVRHTSGFPVWRAGEFAGMSGTTFDITEGFSQEVLEDDTIISKRIGRNLQKIRMIRGITQADFAAGMNVSQSNISQFETGRKNPTIGQLNSFAHALRVPIAAFFDDL